MSLVLKSLLILIFCNVYRIHPDYMYMSYAAWCLAVYSLVWLNEDKPWKHSYHGATADSSLFGYCVLIYLIVFHVVLMNGWAGF